MDISAGLIAKAGAGTAALAATTTTGIVYKDTIAEFFNGNVATDAGIIENQHHSGKSTGKDTLGLSATCTWPTDDNSTQTCSLTADQFKAINFEGKSDGDVDASSINLTIEKTNDTTSFPKGYKFTFNASDKNISNPITLKKNTNTVFKIKTKDGGIWSLERAWTIVELAKKVGLTCVESNSTCTIDTNFNVYISSGKKLLDAKNSSNPKIKIKFEKDQPEYNQGFKFTIEEKSINFSNSNAQVKRLEKYETYEIKEQTESDGKKWYFSRKDTAVSAKNSKLTALSLPSGCTFDENSDEKNCGALSEDSLKLINFDGKTGTPTTIAGTLSNVTLKIRKDGGEGLFADGIKIIFENKNETIKSTELNIDWKPGTNPEYKIEGDKLKRAWDMNKLAGKIGLTSCSNSSGSTKCGLGSEINLFLDSANYATKAKVKDHSDKKISVLKDQANYNQGFKFTVETAISISGGTQKSSSSSITEIEATSYEIKEQKIGDSSKWFLSKVTVPAA